MRQMETNFEIFPPPIQNAFGGVCEIIQRIWEVFHAASEQAARNASSSAKSLIKREERVKNEKKESLPEFTAPAFRVPRCFAHTHTHRHTHCPDAVCTVNSPEVALCSAACSTHCCWHKVCPVLVGCNPGSSASLSLSVNGGALKAYCTRSAPIFYFFIIFLHAVSSLRKVQLTANWSWSSAASPPHLFFGWNKNFQAVPIFPSILSKGASN